MALTQDQIKVEWDKADSDKSGTLSFNEVHSLLKKLNFKPKKKESKRRFKEVDADGSKSLDFAEFVEFLERLRVRPEIDEIFVKFCDPKTSAMTPEMLLKFLQTIQKEKGADIATAKKIIAEFEHKIHETDPAPEQLHLTGFSSYICSKHNNLFNPQNAVVYQDMNQPFAHYWVASSHNTYLLGDQLKGESSIDAYKNALRKGCRCVELDCWDGPDKSMPIIYHGHTLTSKIAFRDVVECVRDFGFLATQYPVILSLEVHCSVEGQQAMAAILKEVLGTAGLLPEQCEKSGVLPSPEKLKGKVLIKGKMVAFTDNDEEEEEQEEEEEKGKKSKKDKKDDKKHAPKIAQELSDLTHLKAVKFPGFTEYKKNKPWEMSSFCETKIGKFISKSSRDYVEYNSRQLSRIFPKGMRVDSSNYDPVPSWNCGAQIVALNYQTGSEPMWTNDGKFQDNGGSGYILKPKYMRDEKITFDPEAKFKPARTIELTIISAWQLPKISKKDKEDKGKGEVIDPYVKISVNGLPADRHSFKTKVISIFFLV
eukprot:TRINITY_DN3379_c0_g1_i2.p1 TRINITY_DN3379_c0_g1~~TRINITY_DN3379_c0_g1_i2.p1  ORF type:complete len:538 (-),score=201.55 TRINITY_DN3379_c0_g1_i2:371-1984(-)